MQSTASIADALRHAEWLLARDPHLARAQAAAILEAVPAHPQALLIEAMALAALGQDGEARAILAPLAASQPHAVMVHFHYGLLLSRAGEAAAAISVLRHALSLNPDLPQGWRVLGDVLFLAGRSGEADAAYARHLRAGAHDPVLMQAGDALCRGDLPQAESVLRRHLKAAPGDVAALRMLAEVATRLGRYPAAETLLEHCLELAPGFDGARYHYAVVLYRQNRPVDALAQIEPLAAADPRDPKLRLLLAACLASTGGYDRAIDLYAGLVAAGPGLPALWLGYGHALRTAGRRSEAIAAYRRVIALAPGIGEAWWSLANLKTGTLGQSDIAQIRALLGAGDLSQEDRFHFQYALGRALEEAGQTEPCFAAYAEGARLRRAHLCYDAEATTAQISRTIALATPDFFAARAGQGCPDPAPIFVIGLPRSGSTLIEQMLASHPLVEGTMELPELANAAREITGAAVYPEAIGAIAPADLARWGARYLERAAAYRKTARPFFIDKMPNNWVHAPLIALILPQAKIIDARRDPMATCFSAFKQHFARGQNYSYDQTELGRFYNDYLRLMGHMDAVLPGRIHRVRYEDMVAATEIELRRLLAYCGLDFDSACLRFYDNPRPVRTASSEQVRRPIFREGIDHWRRFAPYLGELAAVLEAPADR